MTPREHARDALHTMIMSPDEHPGELAIVEAAIRAAAAPLVDALRDCANGASPESARAALAAWSAP